MVVFIMMSIQAKFVNRLKHNGNIREVNMKNSQIKKIALTGLLIALAYVSLFVIRIPIIPSASFLRFDVKDVFIAIIGLLFGPLYAFIGSICVSLFQMISISEYGLIGLAMNILSVSAFTVPLSFVYKNKRKVSGIILGLLFGCITMIGAMLLWNYLITPLYMGVTREVVKGMLLPVFLPFNAIKSFINAIITFILFVNIRKMRVVKDWLEESEH